MPKEASDEFRCKCRGDPMFLSERGSQIRSSVFCVSLPHIHNANAENNSGVLITSKPLCVARYVPEHAALYPGLRFISQFGDVNSADARRSESASRHALL